MQPFKTWACEDDIPTVIGPLAVRVVEFVTEVPETPFVNTLNVVPERVTAKCVQEPVDIEGPVAIPVLLKKTVGVDVFI